MSTSTRHPARQSSGEGLWPQRVAVVVAGLVITALVIGTAVLGGALLTATLGAFTG